jgi:hypothetical protein
MLLFDRNQLGDVDMHRGKGAIKCRDVAASAAGEMTQIRVGDLSVTDEPDENVVREGHVVGPEVMARQGPDSIDSSTDVTRRVPGAKKVPNQRALRDRTCREHLVV